MLGDPDFERERGAEKRAMLDGFKAYLESDDGKKSLARHIEVERERARFKGRSLAYKMRAHLFEEGAKLEGAYKSYVTFTAFLLMLAAILAYDWPPSAPGLFFAILGFSFVRTTGHLIVGVRAKKEIDEIKKRIPLDKPDESHLFGDHRDLP